MVAKVAATESVATVRSALWPLAHLHRLPPRPSDNEHPPVVLVHGYLGHPAMWRPLIRRLYHEGYGDVHTVGYASTRLRMPQIVREIASVVDPLGPGVLLVGHSLGAVASRAYLKTAGGAARVARFVSLGGPHAGTAMYRLAPPNLWDILDPDGPWVQRLSAGDEPVPTVVIRARYDHQVLPPVRASLTGVNEVVLEGQGHNGLLWSTEAHDAVVQALRARS
jgi:pimeloyl-ACP methyl ester carboxylesterase